MFRSLLVFLFFVIPLTACVANSDSEPTEQSKSDYASLAFADSNDQLQLQEGFKAVVVHEGVGSGRHMTVRDNGDIYIKLRSEKNGHGIVALRDADGDGKAEMVEYFGPEDGGTGIEISGDFLYFSSDVAVYRYKLGEGLVPEGEAELIAGGFKPERQHAAKSIALDGAGNLYVNVGAPANACQEEMRTPGSKGMMPCPLLEQFGGIWRFDANKLGQDQMKDGYRYATGLRNCVALEWNNSHNELYSVNHGRDQLNQLFPDLFTAEQNAELPGEEFQLLTDGADHGWPYTYYDWQKGKRVLAPEYGGDGDIEPEQEFNDPIYSFPGHWGPNALHFYEGNQYPEKFRKGAFVAFHGSWNRAPMPQRGYQIAFVPFENNQVAGAHETFANNFAGKSEIATPSEATYRPTGLAEGPDGSLYVVDSKEGRVWRIVYTGI